MHVVELADPDALAVRSHPWSGSLSDAAHRYFDLRRSPGLIRSALEDFRGWENHSATETFYQLLELLNGPDSTLETNDCAFNSPTTNEHAGMDKALQCSGRLMLLFRELPLNTSVAGVHAFTNALARALSGEDEGFGWGVVGATVVPVNFTTLPGTREEQQGFQLMLSFWAWGDDEAEVMVHLDRTFGNLTSVLRGLMAWPDAGKESSP
ncbi:MAG: hypothetical protein ACI9VR_002679 [Cognaticolwellia sp.]|jgi:hypothetical protein